MLINVCEHPEVINTHKSTVCSSPVHVCQMSPHTKQTLHITCMSNALNYKHPNKQVTKLKLCAFKTTPPPPPIHTQ